MRWAWVCAVWACLAGGCGEDSRPPNDAADAASDAPPNDADAASDAQEDSAQDPADLSADAEDGTDADADAPLPEPNLRAFTASGGGTTVALGFEPFRLTVTNASGQQVAQARVRGDDATFSGISVATTRSNDPNVYYEPTLERRRNRGGALSWYQLGRLRAGDADGQGARFEADTVGEDGSPGPRLWITLQPTPHGVALQVMTDRDPKTVYVNLNLEAQEGEGFYGLGEHFDRLDLRGSVREMLIQAELSSESATNEVHVPVPFMLSTRGYGLYLEDRHPSAFDLAKLRPDAVRVTTLSPAPRFHFLTAPSPMGLLERYTDMTGKPAQVPFWALAPQWWRNVNRDQAEVLEDARRGRELGVGSTVVWIDRPWSSYYHNWEFNRAQFPDPEGMFEELGRLGYRVLLHHSPQMNVPGTSDIEPEEDASEGLYEEFLAQGWLVLASNGTPFAFPWGGGTGAFVDWSHPGAVARVQGQIERVTRLGAIGTKMDWDEYLQPNFGDAKLVVNFHNGETNLTMKTWYSALYHKAIIEGFERALGEPSFHVSRSGTSGDQAWNTCIWPGDLDNDFSPHTRGPSDLQEEWNVGGMPAAIAANQSLGMSGYPCFASDIGGYRGGQPSEEVLLRWMGFGVFNAVAQLGGGGSTHMPWSADTPYSDDALRITRAFFALRMRLVPYIYHYLWEAHQTGRPLVRSLWLSYPQDAQARLHEQDFMFGPDLLVAPVVGEGAGSRALYLPAGAWLDLWTGERVEGGRVVEREAPLDIIPAYVRQGAVIPLADPEIQTLWPAQAEGVVSYEQRRAQTVWVFPGEEPREVRLYNGLAVRSVAQGDRALVELEQGDPDEGADPRFAFPPEGLVVWVPTDGGALAGGAARVQLSRGLLPPVELPKGEGCEDCWSYNEAQRRLEIHLSEPGALQITEAQ